MSVSAVLLDLDGTVADTAPDLADALNRLLRRQKKHPLPFAEIRRYASHGAKGLVDHGFPDALPEDAQSLIQDFLALYAERLCVKTRLFPGVMQHLEALEQRGIARAIVTNKMQYLAEPVLKKLGIDTLMQCCVYGDTVERKKPAPDSLLYAARKLRVPPENCLYVGDSERDVLAARAANMPVLITAYGYESAGATKGLWGAHGVVETLADVLPEVDAFSSVQKAGNPNVSDSNAPG